MASNLIDVDENLIDFSVKCCDDTASSLSLTTSLEPPHLLRPSVLHKNLIEKSVPSPSPVVSSSAQLSTLPKDTKNPIEMDAATLETEPASGPPGPGRKDSFAGLTKLVLSGNYFNNPISRGTTPVSTVAGQTTLRAALPAAFRDCPSRNGTASTVASPSIASGFGTSRDGNNRLALTSSLSPMKSCLPVSNMRTRNANILEHWMTSKPMNGFSVAQKDNSTLALVHPVKSVDESYLTANSSLQATNVPGTALFEGAGIGRFSTIHKTSKPAIASPAKPTETNEPNKTGRSNLTGEENSAMLVGFASPPHAQSPRPLAPSLSPRVLYRPVQKTNGYADQIASDLAASMERDEEEANEEQLAALRKEMKAIELDQPATQRHDRRDISPVLPSQPLRPVVRAPPGFEPAQRDARQDSQSTGSVRIMSAVTEDTKEPIVRLTMAVYDSIIQNANHLKLEMATMEERHQNELRKLKSIHSTTKQETELANYEHLLTVAERSAGHLRKEYHAMIETKDADMAVVMDSYEGLKREASRQVELIAELENEVEALRKARGILTQQLGSRPADNRLSLQQNAELKKLRCELSVLAQQVAEKEERVQSLDAEQGPLRFELQYARKQQAEYEHIIAEKDRDMRSLEGKLSIAELYKEQVTSLKVEVEKLRQSSVNASQDIQAAAVAEAIESQQEEISKLKDELDMATLSLRLMDGVKTERDYLRKRANEQQHSQDLVKELNQKGRELTGMKNELEASKQQNALLTNQLKQLSQTPTATKQIADLEAQIRTKTADTGRLRNENQALNQRLESQKNLGDKLAEGGARLLRGAAHLVEPAPRAKIPKKAFDCINCYVKNLECNSAAKCGPCTQNGTKCLRWRCSLHHVLKECPDLPCRLEHDSNGWVHTQYERPKW